MLQLSIKPNTMMKRENDNRVSLARFCQPPLLQWISEVAMEL